MINLPNGLTLLRFALVPAIAVQLLQGEYGVACVLFIVSALSDLADGMIARAWNQRTRFGAVADPLADKLTMLTVTVLLTVQHGLPWWFAVAVVLRDGLIVVGALAYHLLIGPVEMAPSRISKLNTALELSLLFAVMAIRAGYVSDGVWRQALLVTTLVTIALSGGHYVLVWSRKAAQSQWGPPRRTEPLCNRTLKDAYIDDIWIGLPGSGHCPPAAAAAFLPLRYRV